MKPNWPKHVAKFAEDNDMKLGDAMKNKECKKMWKDMKKRGGKPDEDDVVETPVEGASVTDATEGASAAVVPTVASEGVINENDNVPQSNATEGDSAAPAPAPAPAESLADKHTESATDAKSFGGGRRSRHAKANKKSTMKSGKKSKKTMKKSRKMRK